MGRFCTSLSLSAVFDLAGYHFVFVIWRKSRRSEMRKRSVATCCPVLFVACSKCSCRLRVTPDFPMAGRYSSAPTTKAYDGERGCRLLSVWLWPREVSGMWHLLGITWPFRCPTTSPIRTRASFRLHMLAKSFKMMLVMVWVVEVGGKRYMLVEWCVVVEVTAGVMDVLITGQITPQHAMGTRLFGLGLGKFLQLDGLT